MAREQRIGGLPARRAQPHSRRGRREHDGLASALPNHVGPTELLPQRLNMLGIDANYLQKEMPLTFRDLARVCSACQASRRCARDLARGDVEAGMDSYCLNGATLDDMTLHPRRPSRT